MKKQSTALIEQPLFESIQLIEAAEADSYKLLTIRGTASKGGHVNKNGRLYPTSVLAKVVETAQADIKKGKLLGELDHPPDKGTLSRAAVKFTALWMEGDDMLFEADVLPTDDGRQLETLLRAGVGIGMSTRGYGTLRPIDYPDGTVYEVQPDFEMKGIDCVLEQSNEYGKVSSFEHVEGGSEDMDLDTLKKEHPELVEQIASEAAESAIKEAEEDLHKEFELKVSKAVEEQKDAFVAEGREAALESAEVKGLRSVLEGIIAALKPMLPEAKSVEELDADLRQENEGLKQQVESLTKDLGTLRESVAKAEQEKEQEAVKEAVTAKVNELTEGHRFATQLRERLAGVESVESVQEAFDREVKFIESLVEGQTPPKGKGKVTEEDEGQDGQNMMELTEVQKRQKALAGN